MLNAITTMALPTDAQRIFHGRGGLYPGCEHWALDAFPPVVVLTSFQPASDDELAYLYSRCDALIFASAVEGFGLPLVEALKAGLPVLASDIPVFREIASEHVRFFERTPEAIATAVQAFATERPGRVTNYQPLSWADACSQLLNKVSRFLHAG